MQKLIKENVVFILHKNIYKNNIEVMKSAISSLNHKNLVIISWLKNIWKVNLIKDFLAKTWTLKDFFYFNKALDTENKIKNNKDLEKLLKIYIELYKSPKIIILHNINKI